MSFSSIVNSWIIARASSSVILVYPFVRLQVAPLAYPYFTTLSRPIKGGKRMRRFICFCCVLLSLFACSLAEENHPVEILFRGNEWGSTYQEVKKSYPNEILWSLPDSEKPYCVEYRLFGDDKVHKYDTDVGCRVKPYDFSLEENNFIAAGYPVIESNLYLAYVPENNGLIDHNNPNTALYCASYSIKPNDMEFVYSDLTIKLSSLYGKPGFEFVKNKGEKYEMRYLSWFGINDTVVSLVWNGNTYINIRYGWLKGNELLAKAYESLLLEEKMTDSSNTDGL